MKRLTDSIDKVNDRIGKIISYLILFTIVLLCFEVVTRYGFNRPTIWAHESSQYFYGVYFTIGVAYALLHDSHVSVDILYSHLSSKAKAITELITWTLLLIICVVLIWKGGQIAWQSLITLERSDTIWHPPFYPLKLAVPVGAFLLLLQGLSRYLKNIMLLKDTRKYK